MSNNYPGADVLDLFIDICELISDILGEADVLTKAEFLIAETYEPSSPKNENPEESRPSETPLHTKIDIHCKAFVVGFISTAFTLLPFIIGYAGKHRLDLDPSKVVIGLGKVSGIGGLVYVVLNQGSPLVYEEYDRMYDFIHPYIPMILGSMGSKNFEPIFREMTDVLNKHEPNKVGYSSSTSTSTFGSTSSFTSSATRSSPSNPPRATFGSRTEEKVREVLIPAASPSGMPSVRVMSEQDMAKYSQLEQVMPTIYGQTVALEVNRLVIDPNVWEVDVVDISDTSDEEDDDDEDDPVGKEVSIDDDDFEFDRDAVLDYDHPTR